MSELPVTFARGADGVTRAELVVDGMVVSRLQIVPFTLRLGRATLRMDGIGGVETDRQHRRHGYARRLLEATVAHMRGGEAALSMLYGIRDFYTRFGYATAGPDHFIYLTRLDEPATLPPGWTVRPARAGDVPAIQRLYAAQTADAVGAAARDAGAPAWRDLREALAGRADDACRVVVDAGGNAGGYLWKAKQHWYVRLLERERADDFVVGEAMAENETAAAAVLAACRQWGAEASAGRERPYRRVALAQPAEGPLADEARVQDATVAERYARCGGSMARVVDAGRLVASLEPELRGRVEEAGVRFRGTLRIETEAGAATFAVAPGGETATVRLPQAALARLALGAYPPAAVLARLDSPPDAPLWPVLEALFPRRHAHMYLPDRY